MASSSKQAYEAKVYGILLRKYNVPVARALNLTHKESLVIDTGHLVKEKPSVVAKWIALNNGILRFKR